MAIPNEEYLANLSESIRNVRLMPLAIHEPIYQIDLNSRKITPPPFIGVEHDHKAEYIFFEMDRYFDLIDLSESIGLIMFKNSKNEEFCQLIPYYDIYTHYNKIIFPWFIQAPAALYSGQITFAIKFFKIDPITRKLVYELNTLSAHTTVLNGWVNDNTIDSYNLINTNDILVDESIINELNTIISSKQFLSIYWMDVDEQNPINDSEYDSEILPVSEG